MATIRLVIRCPLRRFEVTADSSSVSPPSGKPLVRFAALQRVVCFGPAGVIGSLPPPGARRFRRRWRFFSRSRPPRFASWVHPLVSFTPLQRLRLSPAPSLSTRSGLPWGCGPSSRHQPAASLRWSSHSTTASPTSFLTTSATSAAGLCGFVSPRSHVQGSLFKGFPSHTAVRAFARRLPSCRFRSAPANDCSRAPVRCLRLQGFFSVRESVAGHGCLSRHQPDPLLSFRLRRV